MKSIDYGELPLHFAIEEKASHDVIKLLLEAYPKATQVKSRQGWLPLHYALRYKAADITTKMILQAFPRAVESPDVDGELH
jgi:ankyrin repeat protein